MAQYSVNFSCGHSGTVQLYGPTKERERKIEWLEKGLCPDCYKKQQMDKAMNDETPVTIKISLNTANFSNNNNRIIINAVAQGGTYREKENLKSLGFHFGDLPTSGAFGLFNSPKKGWYRIIGIKELDEISSVVLHLGPYSVVNEISEIDIATMGEKLRKIDLENKEKKDREAELLAKKEKIGVSPIRKWIQETFGTKVYWNEKVYDSGIKYNKPARVYIDSVEKNIPKDVWEEHLLWRKKRDEINAQ